MTQQEHDEVEKIMTDVQKMLGLDNGQVRAEKVSMCLMAMVMFQLLKKATCNHHNNNNTLFIKRKYLI